MKTPTKEQMTVAAGWLRSINRDDSSDGERRDCRAVAALLDQMASGKVKSPARVKEAA